MYPILRDIHRAAGLGHAHAKPSLSGPLHTLPREGKPIRQNPRCFPSTGPPPKGCALAPASFCFQKRGGAKSRRLFIHRAFFHPGQAKDRDDSMSLGDYVL